MWLARPVHFSPLIPAEAGIRKGRSSRRRGTTKHTKHTKILVCLVKLELAASAVPRGVSFVVEKSLGPRLRGDERR